MNAPADGVERLLSPARSHEREPVVAAHRIIETLEAELAAADVAPEQQHAKSELDRDGERGGLGALLDNRAPVDGLGVTIMPFVPTA